MRGLCPVCLSGLFAPLEEVAPDSGLLLLPSTRFGDFELLEELGQGGASIVFKARQLSLDRVVALKLIKSGWAADFQAFERFSQEAKITAALDHAHVLPVYQVGEHEGQHYLAMKLVAGGTLARQIAEGKFRLSGPEASRPPEMAWATQQRIARLMETVARAVHYAHQRGIIHRDLKPSNLLLDEEGRLYIADFGIAHWLKLGAHLTHTRQIVGTPQYMSPEQASGGKVPLSTACDVYSLGVILYELLTGKPPFQDADPLLLLRKVVEEEPVPPSRRQPGVHRDLETICLKCLRKEPEARYGSAQELGDDLNRFLRGEPIQGRRASSREQVWRWCQRRPLVAGLVLALFVGIVGFVCLQWRHTSEVTKLNHNLRQTLSHSVSRQAHVLFELQKTDEAMTQLAQQVERDPADAPAVNRLLSALTWRNWPLPLMAFGPHSKSVTYAGFTLDGTRVMTADDKATITLWNVTNGALMAGPFLQTDSARGLQREGDWLATQFRDGSLRVLPLAAARPAMLTLPTGTSTVAFSASPTLAAIIANDAVELWDVLKSNRLARLEQPTPPMLAVISQDGRQLASVAQDSVLFWELPAGKQIARWTNTLTGPVSAIFSAGDRFFCLENGERFVCYDVATGREVWQSAPEGQIRSMAWNQRRDRIAVVTKKDQSIKVLDGTTGRELRSFSKDYELVGDHPFSPDGKSLLLSRKPNHSTLVLHSTVAPRVLCETMHGEFLFEDAEFSPDGRHIIVADRSLFACLYDVQLGTAAPVMLGGGDTVVAYESSQAGDSVITSVTRGQARLWGLHPLQALGPELRQSNAIHQVALAPDARRAATASTNGLIVIWNPLSGEKIAESIQPEGSPARLAFSPDGTVLAVVTTRLRLYLLEAATGQLLHPPLSVRDNDSGRDTHVYILSFSPSGARLLVGSSAGVAVFDPKSGRRVWQRPIGPSYSAAFSPDERMVGAAASQYQQAFLLDAASGNPLLPPLPHPNFVSRLAFAWGGEFLVTACMDGVASVWNVADGQLLRTMEGAAEGLGGVRFSRYGSRISLASQNRTVRVWDATHALPLTESMHSEVLPMPVGPLSLAEFADQDRRLLAFSNMSKGLSLWPAEAPPLPAPPWLPELAQLLAGTKRGNWRDPNTSHVLRLLELRRQLAHSPGDDYYARWARWFFADRSTRPPFPE